MVNSKFGGRWVKPKGFRSEIWIPDGGDYDPTKPTEFEEFCEELIFLDGVAKLKPIIWAQWQLEIIRQLLGLVWSESGLRIIRTCLFVAGRGNAKTFLLSVLALFGLLDPDEPNPEVDLFSLSRETANRMFKVIANLVRTNPELDALLNVSAQIKKITAPTLGGELVVRSGDADAEMGHNPSLALVDELASLRNRLLYDAVKTAFGKRPEGAMVMMTTPALDIGKFARQEYDNAKQIQADRSLDPTYLPVIYEADENDDLWDPKTWRKANPAIESGFLSEDIIAQEARDAQRDATRVHAFKVLRLALWAEVGGGFLDFTAFNECAVPFFDEDGRPKYDLEELPCWFGLDMAGTTDLASLCMLWWDQAEDVCYVLWRHWSTRAMAGKLNDHTGGQWNVWADSGNVALRLFPGDWIDNSEVADEVADLADIYRPKEIGIDSYLSREMNQKLGENRGLPVFMLSQTGRATNAATKMTQELVGKRRLYHNGDPVARWCLQNTEVVINSEGFPKVIKRDLDPNVRIDAMIALQMAVDCRLRWERTGDAKEVQVFTFTPEAEKEEDNEPIRIGDRQ